MEKCIIKILQNILSNYLFENQRKWIIELAKRNIEKKGDFTPIDLYVHLTLLNIDLKTALKIVNEYLRYYNVLKSC